MTERVIIPEDSHAELFIGSGSVTAALNYDSVKEGNVAPTFFYDADFIDGALNEGYLQTLERLRNPMSLSDDKKTDMLLKDMIIARALGPESFLSETTRFVRAADRVNSGVGGLIEGKIPVSDELWLRADSLSRALVASVQELSEKLEIREDNGSRFRNWPTSDQHLRMVGVRGLSPRGDGRDFRFHVPIFVDGGTMSNPLYWVPYAEDYWVYFHFLFDPAADKRAEVWKMQSALNTFGNFGNFHSESYLLCTEAGVQFNEVVDESFSFEPSINKRITRGLIRIQNHLNNPGMTDEEYLSLING
jgi:hypothetical protein